MLTSSVEIRGLDHLREFVDCRGEGETRTCIDPEFVVASPQDLDKGMATDYDAGRSVPFGTSHRAKSGLQSAMIGFNSIVGGLGGVVQGGRE